MVKILRHKDKNFHKNFNILLKKRSVSDHSIESIVDKIIKDVQLKGDKEVLRLSNKFDKIKFNRPSKRMFETDFLKKAQNSLEKIVINKYSILKRIRSYLRNLEKPIFVRMTGSGSAFIAYYHSKKQCDIAKKQFCKDYKKYWCISSKTI